MKPLPLMNEIKNEIWEKTRLQVWKEFESLTRAIDIYEKKTEKFMWDEFRRRILTIRNLTLDELYSQIESTENE